MNMAMKMEFTNNTRVLHGIIMQKRIDIVTNNNHNKSLKIEYRHCPFNIKQRVKDTRDVRQNDGRKVLILVTKKGEELILRS
jgi:hypothetical protein